MAESGGGCCRCCFRFILTSGLTALFMWLSLRTSYPTCSIEQFYVPALNRTANSTDNHTISFELLLANRMKDKGVHYNNISLTFLYGGKDSSSITIANYTVKAFYQGHKKKAHRVELVHTTGVPWEKAIDAVSNGLTVNFGVRLTTRLKFKIICWYTKRYQLEVAGDVAVGGEGEKVSKKGVKLKSGAADRGSRWDLRRLSVEGNATGAHPSKVYHPYQALRVPSARSKMQKQGDSQSILIMKNISLSRAAIQLKARIDIRSS